MFKILTFLIIYAANIYGHSDEQGRFDALTAEIEVWHPSQLPLVCEEDMRYLTETASRLVPFLVKDSTRAQTIFTDEAARWTKTLLDMVMLALIDETRWPEQQRVQVIHGLWDMSPHRWSQVYDRRVPRSGSRVCLAEYLTHKIATARYPELHAAIARASGEIVTFRRVLVGEF